MNASSCPLDITERRRVLENYVGSSYICMAWLATIQSPLFLLQKLRMTASSIWIHAVLNLELKGEGFMTSSIFLKALRLFAERPKIHTNGRDFLRSHAQSKI
jgi:hypothetical protein